MTKAPLIAPTHLFLLVCLSSAFPAHAVGESRRELSETLTRIVFPKDKIIEVIVSNADEKVRSTSREAMKAHFDYSQFVNQVARQYASALTENDLNKVIAFHRTRAGRTALAVADQTPVAQQPAKRSESPPEDTYDTRLVPAMEIATLMTEEDLVVGGLEMILADKPAAERNAMLAGVKSIYMNPAQLRMMRQEKAKQFVPVLTTDELKQVAAFYATSTGKKLLSNNVLIGKTAMEAIQKEALQASEKYRDQQLENLRRTINRSR